MSFIRDVISLYRKRLMDVCKGDSVPCPRIIVDIPDSVLSKRGNRRSPR